jgi:hypothetical protein
MFSNSSSHFFYYYSSREYVVTRLRNYMDVLSHKRRITYVELFILHLECVVTNLRNHMQQEQLESV